MPQVRVSSTNGSGTPAAARRCSRLSAPDTDYFAADKALVINLRVSDLDGLLAELRAAGFAAETRAD